MPAKNQRILILKGIRLSLESVTRIAQNTADSVATVAASLDRCSVPNRKTGDTGGLAPDEMEYGMGTCTSSRLPPTYEETSLHS